jgi:SAM-dependent methyltransferase
MSNETAKANQRRKNSWVYDRVFSGRVIDIGCGDDILNKSGDFKNIISVTPFDLAQGDAQYINLAVKENYDCVYSSNCLEHMVDVKVALKNWWEVVKPGGYMVFTVPDEDLYEQGRFPSLWNFDHKWTFTIYKTKSWTPKSINILDLIKELHGAKVLKIELEDQNYDYRIAQESVFLDQTVGKAESFIEVILQKL